MEVLLIAAVIGVIPGWIAQSKGRSFAAWWIFGSLLFIVALPMAIALKPETDAPGFTKPGQILDTARAQAGSGRRCPFCAEFIRPEALVCRFCGRDLPEAGLERAPAATSVVPSMDESAVPKTDGPSARVDAATPAATANPDSSVARCGHPKREGHKFCTTCGSPTDEPRCGNGHVVDDGDKFCAACGVALAPAGA